MCPTYIAAQCVAIWKSQIKRTHLEFNRFKQKSIPIPVVNIASNVPIPITPFNINPTTMNKISILVRAYLYGIWK